MSYFSKFPLTLINGGFLFLALILRKSLLNEPIGEKDGGGGTHNVCKPESAVLETMKYSGPAALETEEGEVWLLEGVDETV